MSISGVSSGRGISVEVSRCLIISLVLCFFGEGSVGGGTLADAGGGKFLGEVSWKLSPGFFVGVEGVASVAVMGFCGVSTSIVSAYWGRVRHTQQS